MSFKFEVNTQGSYEEDYDVAEVKPKKVFVATPEQVAAKDMVLVNKVSKINSIAGAGKTSSLAYIAGEIICPSLYLAFNKSMADEAKNKFPDHVECLTTHALAYRVFGKGLQHKLKRPMGKYVNVAMTGAEIARYYSLPDFVLSADKYVSKAMVGLVIKETVNRYEQTDRDFVRDKDIPQHHLEALREKHGKSFDEKKFKKLVTRFAKSLWEERIDPYSEVCCTHDTYLKLYVLSKPDLSSYDIIYVDEFQDVNSVVLQLITMQKTKIVAVGDARQAIYGWRGAINALQKLKCAESQLTKSFRYGKASAELATMILQNKVKIEGFEHLSTKVGYDVVDTDKKHTILFRTNADLLFTALKLITNGESINISIDVQDFVKILQSADALHKGDLKGVKHEAIVPYNTWEELVDESKYDRDLKRVAAIVDDGDVGRVVGLLHTHKNSDDAKINLITAHRSKGLEFEQVILADDFPSNYDNKGRYVGLSEEETNLLYVAVTRAVCALNINSVCKEFYDINNQHPYEDDNESIQVINCSSGGDMAQYEMESVIEMENLRNLYANSEMSQEESFEYGFIDSSGTTTDFADFSSSRVDLDSSEEITQKLNTLAHVFGR